MRLKYLYSIIIIGTSFMAACQSGVEHYAQVSDEASEISFTVNGLEKVVSRADDGYRAWDSQSDPQTMGVYGYQNLNTETPIFYNVSFSPDGNSKVWIVSNDGDKKSWVDFPDYTKDFLAYMPYKAIVGDNDAPLAISENKYTLSLPYTQSATFCTATNDFPLLCNNAISQEQPSNVEIKFDQTLTGYTFSFKLGIVMDKVRDITITRVRLYGKGFPESGTVSRTYTLNSTGADRWTAGAITWSSVTTKELTKDGTDDAAAYTVTPTTEQTEGLLLNSSTFQQWGSGILYTIPQSLDNFTPTIEVTYTVKTEKDDGSVVTRKDVVSKIVLNKTNFTTYTGGEPDVINNIQILIVPKYLYVLADEDQQAGQMVIQ